MAFKILIVDDSALTRSLIKRSIGLSGLPVDLPLEANNGIRALALLMQHKIDLVLADLNMPEMGGADLLRRMSQNPETAAIPVVIVSAEPSVARLEELCRNGAKGYLRKPFAPESIRDLLTPFMEAPHATA